MASIKFYLRPPSKKVNPSSVYIEFIKSREERFRVPIGLKIYKKYYDAKNQRVNKEHPNAELVNKELDVYRVPMSEALTKVDAGSMSLIGAQNYVIKQFDATDLETYLATTDTWEEEEKGHYKKCIKYFKNVLGIKRKLRFDAINNITLGKYKKKAKKLVKDGLNSATTLNTYRVGVMSIYNDAVANGQAPQIVVAKRNGVLKVTRTNSRANTTEEIADVIKKVRTIEQWQSVALWLLMFGLRGLYPADLVRFNANRVRNIKGDKIGPNWNGWRNEDIFIDYERSKTSIPMFIKFDKVTRILWERVKMSIMFKHADKKFDGKHITPGIKDKCSLYDYDIDKYRETSHKQLWDGLNEKFRRSLDAKHITFKRARKTYFQLAEDRYEKLYAKFLVGHELDKVTDNSYSDYRREKVVKRTNKRHKKILKAFKYEELVYMALDKLLTLIKKPRLNYPYWIFYAKQVFKEGRNLFVNIGTDTWQQIDKKYNRLFNDGAMLIKNKDDYKVITFSHKATDETILVKKSTLDKIPDDLIQDWDGPKKSVYKPLNPAEKEIRKKIKEMALN